MTLANALRLNRQARMVLGYLERGGRLTRRSAIEQFNVLNLPTRIFEIKGAGYPVVVDRKPGPNGVAIAEYSLAA